jgi:hypothetical protein
MLTKSVLVTFSLPTVNSAGSLSCAYMAKEIKTRIPAKKVFIALKVALFSIGFII